MDDNCKNVSSKAGIINDSKEEKEIEGEQVIEDKKCTENLIKIGKSIL